MTTLAYVASTYLTLHHVVASDPADRIVRDRGGVSEEDNLLIVSMRRGMKWASQLLTEGLRKGCLGFGAWSYISSIHVTVHTARVSFRYIDF